MTRAHANVVGVLFVGAAALPLLFAQTRSGEDKRPDEEKRDEGERGGGSGGPGGRRPMALVVPTVDVKSYGAVGNGSADDTNAIQNAVNAAPVGGTVYIGPGTYMIRATFPTGGIQLKSNMTLVMSQGTTLQAFTNSATEYSIVRVWDKKDVNVVGGTLKGERATHTGTGGEWGFGLDVRGSEDITIEDVNARDCWGDGFFIDRSLVVAGRPNSKNVKMRGCNSTNNRRQGLSIVGLSGGVVEASTFSNNKGTAPQSGIDLEPDGPLGAPVEDVRIVNCHFYNNQQGVMGAGSSICRRNVVENCFSSGHEQGYLLMDGPVQFTFVNNTATNNWIGFYLWKSDQCVVTGNTAFRNTGPGFKLRALTNSVISSNLASENSLGSNNYYDGLWLTDISNYNLVTGNVCRRGVATTGPRYGIRIDPGCVGNMVTNNDLYRAGITGSFSDAGSGTVLTTGNRQ
jgi:parallel beta-helix repeat protein